MFGVERAGVQLRELGPPWEGVEAGPGGLPGSQQRAAVERCRHVGCPPLAVPPLLATWRRVWLATCADARPPPGSGVRSPCGGHGASALAPREAPPGPPHGPSRAPCPPGRPLARGSAPRRPHGRPSVRAGIRSCGSGGSCSRPASTRPPATAATTATAPRRMARKSLESGCSWRRRRGGVRSASTCATCPW